MNRLIRVALVAIGFSVPVLWQVTAAARTSHGPTEYAHSSRGLSRSRVQRVMLAADAVSAVTPNAELVARGRMLFESNTLARHGESCATCHAAGTAVAGIGTIVHPRGPTDFTGPRDPLSLIGAGRSAPYRWQGDVATLEQMVTGVVLQFFRDSGTQPASVTAEQVAALVAYLDSIEAPQTAFDLGTLSPSALRGQELFQGKGGCMSCHGGPLLTDNKLHDTGVPMTPGSTDFGNVVVHGAFNTPALRDIANSAPYMHNGIFTTLREVVEFYDTISSVGPLHLTSAEIDDLVAYLEAL